MNTSCEFITNDCITTTKQSTTKPCAYFLGIYCRSIPSHHKTQQTTTLRKFLRWAVWKHYLNVTKQMYMHICIYIYIYIYIKWTVFVNVTTKSAQYAHARMIAINWLNSQTSDASLTSRRQPFCKNGSLHDVRDPSLVCELSQLYIRLKRNIILFYQWYWYHYITWNTNNDNGLKHAVKTRQMVKRLLYNPIWFNAIES